MTEIEQAMVDRDEAYEQLAVLMGRVIPAMDGAGVAPIPYTDEARSALRSITDSLVTGEGAVAPPIWTADGVREDLIPELLRALEATVTADERVERAIDDADD